MNALCSGAAIGMVTRARAVAAVRTELGMALRTSIYCNSYCSLLSYATARAPVRLDHRPAAWRKRVPRFAVPLTCIHSIEPQRAVPPSAQRAVAFCCCSAAWKGGNHASSTPCDAPQVTSVIPCCWRRRRHLLPPFAIPGQLLNSAAAGTALRVLGWTPNVRYL